MKEIKCLQFLPSVLLVICLLLWTKTLVFDEATNRTERKLELFWARNLERAERLMMTENNKLRNLMEMKIRRRPDDRILVHYMDSVIKYRNIILEKLNDRAMNTADYTKILDNYQLEVKIVLDSLQKKRRVIFDDEIEQVLARTNIGLTFHEMNSELERLAIRNQIINSDATLMNYFAVKIGSSIECCFERFRPMLSFDSNLKVGETATGKMAVHVTPCGLDENSVNYIGKYQLSINGKPQTIKYGIVNSTIMLDDSFPKRLNVETTHFEYNNEEILTVKDTIRRSQTITLYPPKLSFDEN